MAENIINVNGNNIIDIDTGIEVLTLRGIGEDGKITTVDIAINPTDANFAARLYKTFQELADKEADYEEAVKTADPDETIRLAEELNAEMREYFVRIFGRDIIQELIGNVHAYARGDGLPVWANIIIAVRDKMDESAIAANKRGDERMKFYTAKYQTKDHQKARK